MNTLRRHNRGLLSLVLLGAFVWSLSGVAWTSGIVHPGGIDTLLELLRSMITPDLSPSILKLGLTAAWRTLVYATCGMTLAILLALPGGVLASGVLARNPVVQWGLTGVFRGLLGLMRSIHELVWAWLFVAAFGLTPLAAIAAICIPYGGILGRILADLINDVPESTLRALRSAGANPFQTLLYGRLPHALPDLIAYTMFRFECSIRSAAIMSFIGLGGLGYQIQISLDDLHFSEAWTFVYFLIGLVVAVSAWSSEIRRALTH